VCRPCQDSAPNRFHFYSDERNEPPYIHVETTDGECKYWLEPVRLAGNKGLRPTVLRAIERMVYENEKMLRERYDEFFEEG
jgi:hypothetical protein